MIKIPQVSVAQVHKPAEHQDIGGRAHPVSEQSGVVTSYGLDEILNRIAVGQLFPDGAGGISCNRVIDHGFTCDP